jgi:DNA-binding transcriptional ArsR family regulator
MPAMPHSRTRTAKGHPLGSRRLVRALLVAVLAGAMFGVAVGASNGTQDARHDGAVAIPAPSLGDRGSYQLRVDGSYQSAPDGQGQPFRFLDFAWGAGSEVRAGDGLVHDADRVQTSGWDYNGWAVALNHLHDSGGVYGLIPESPVWTHHNQTLVFEQGAPSLLAVEDSSRSVDSSNATLEGVPGIRNGVGPLGPVSLVRQTTTTNGTERAFPEGGTAACLFVNDLQNRTLRVGDRVSFGPACDLHGVLTFFPLAYRAAGLETVNGLSAIRLEAVGMGGAVPESGQTALHFGGDLLRIWMANGIPYPVRIAWHGQGLSQLDLVGFQAGRQARQPGSAPQDPVPGLALADRKPWGLDEAGVHHPFPLSQAFQDARDDPQFTALREYMARHPDAFVGSAHYRVSPAQAGEDRIWSFTVTDGGSWIIVEATRSAPASPLPVSLPTSIPDMGQPSVNTTYSSSAEQHGSAYYQGMWPTPSEAPTQVPTLASLFDRWSRYASAPYRDLGPDAWGFDITCFRVLGGDCRQVWTSVEAGHKDAVARPTRMDTAATPPELRQSAQERISLLSVFGNRTQAITEQDLDSDSRTGLETTSPLPPPTTPAGTVPVPSGAAAWIPTPEQAVGVGAAAAAVGLLYYLWPLAKGGTLGLFSRLKEPEVLGHPARAQILQLIEAEPGIHFKQMARRTGLPNGSLVHHLETLRRSGAVVARPAGGYTLYFLGSRVPAGSAEAASVLKADGARRILELVRGEPGLSSAEVASRCGLQPSTVTYHVQRLQAAGLLTGLRDGRSVRLHPAESAAS